MWHHQQQYLCGLKVKVKIKAQEGMVFMVPIPVPDLEFTGHCGGPYFLMEGVMLAMTFENLLQHLVTLEAASNALLP